MTAKYLDKMQRHWEAGARYAMYFSRSFRLESEFVDPETGCSAPARLASDQRRQDNDRDRQRGSGSKMAV